MVTRDIYSYCDRNVKYADRFDKVSIVSRSGHVVILENKKGRFPTIETNIVKIDPATLKEIEDINKAILELSERQNTPANIKRKQVLESKLIQILNQ